MFWSISPQKYTFNLAAIIFVHIFLCLKIHLKHMHISSLVFLIWSITNICENANSEPFEKIDGNIRLYGIFPFFFHLTLIYSFIHVLHTIRWSECFFFASSGKMLLSQKKRKYFSLYLGIDRRIVCTIQYWLKCTLDMLYIMWRVLNIFLI